MIEQTQTEIAAIQGQVIIAHSKPVGRQYLTPALARQMAAALIERAVQAEAQQHHQEN